METGPTSRTAAPVPDQARVQEVARLRQRDAAVRRHEQAHAAAGGPHAGAPSYEYTQGPDGKQYATGGEVPIDTAPIRGDPQGTISKMETVRRAALAPSDPSAQDLKIAAQAQAEIGRARADLAEERLSTARATAGTRAGLIAIQEDRDQTARQAP